MNKWENDNSPEAQRWQLSCPENIQKRIIKIPINNLENPTKTQKWKFKSSSILIAVQFFSLKLIDLENVFEWSGGELGRNAVVPRASSLEGNIRCRRYQVRPHRNRRVRPRCAEHRFHHRRPFQQRRHFSL